MSNSLSQWKWFPIVSPQAEAITEAQKYLKPNEPMLSYGSVYDQIYNIHANAPFPTCFNDWFWTYSQASNPATKNIQKRYMEALQKSQPPVFFELTDNKEFCYVKCLPRYFEIPEYKAYIDSTFTHVRKVGDINIFVSNKRLKEMSR